MVMDRRHFLALIASGLAAGLTDPELLLWTPKSMIAVPANYGNTFITPQWVFDELTRFVTREDGLRWWSGFAASSTQIVAADSRQQSWMHRVACRNGELRG